MPETFTFLFTDIEGSTVLWEQHPEMMRGTLASHDALVREAIVANNGRVFNTGGDAFCAVFIGAPEALTTALTAQRTLAAETGRVFGIYAEVARRRGRPTEARKYIYDALRTASGLLGMVTILTSMSSYLILLADQGPEEHVLEMRTLLDKHPFVRNSRSSHYFLSPRLAEPAKILPQRSLPRQKRADKLETCKKRPQRYWPSYSRLSMID